MTARDHRSSSSSPGWRCRSASSRTGCATVAHALPFAVDPADAGRRLARQARRAAASSACSRCRLLWALALLGLGRLALRARTREAGGAGWLSRFVVWRRLVGAQIRVAAAVPRLVRARPRRRVPDLVHRLPRGARDLPQRAAARRVERRTRWRSSTRSRRSRSRSPTCSIGHLDQFPQKIRDGNFDIVLVRPRGTLFQVVASDFQLRRLGKAAQGLRRARLRARRRCTSIGSPAASRCSS